MELVLFRLTRYICEKFYPGENNSAKSKTRFSRERNPPLIQMQWNNGGTRQLFITINISLNVQVNEHLKKCVPWNICSSLGVKNINDCWASKFQSDLRLGLRCSFIINILSSETVIKTLFLLQSLVISLVITSKC